MSDKPWYIYLIRCKGNMLYTGISTDISRRFSEHQAGKGAKFLRGKSPLTLVFQQEIASHSLALQYEAKIKKLSKKNKECIIQAGVLPPSLTS